MSMYSELISVQPDISVIIVEPRYRLARCGSSMVRRAAYGHKLISAYSIQKASVFGMLSVT